MREETRDGRRGDKDRSLKTSHFGSEGSALIRSIVMYVVCGSGRGWAALDTCKMNEAIISFDRESLKKC